MALVPLLPSARCQEPKTTTPPSRSVLRILQRIKPGEVYRVRIAEKLSGQLLLPDDSGVPSRPIALSGQAQLVYRERPLAADTQGRITHVLRLYERVDYRRRVGDQDQDAQLRPEVRRVVVAASERGASTYSPDGPLLPEEVELIGTHTLAPVLEEFVPRSSALELAVGMTWPAPSGAAAELAGLATIREGSLTCRYNGTEQENGRATARIGISGSVLGPSKEGRSRNEIRGTIHLDPATGRMISFQAGGTKVLLDGAQRPLGRLQVDYQLTIEPVANDPDLTDAAVTALPAEPHQRDLSLLFAHPGLGVRLLYPRSWRLASVRDRELLLHTAGSSLVIQIERPGAAPAPATYSQEVAGHFAKQKLDARLTVPVREASSPHGRIGHFRYEAVIDGSPTVLDYWVISRGSFGATFAGRLAPAAAAAASKEIEWIARNAEFSEPLRPAKPEPKPAQPPTR